MTYTNIINKILPILFAVASFGLMIRISNIDYQTANPAQSLVTNFLMGSGNLNILTIKLFDFLIVAIGALLIFNSDFRETLKKIKPELLKWVFYFLALMAFIAAGQIIGYLKTGVNLMPDVFPHYLRTIFNIYTFFLILAIFAFNKKIIKHSVYAVFISPIVITPIFFGFFKKMYLMDGHRLTGTMVNPQNLAIWLVVAFIFGIAIFLMQNKLWTKTLTLSWLSIISCFILWTETRGALIAILLSALFVIILDIFRKNFKRVKILISVIILVFFIGFLLLPKTLQGITTIRVLNKTSYQDPQQQERILDLKNNEQHERIFRIFEYLPKGLVSDSTRLNIWLKSIIIISKNPAGLGFNYLLINPHMVNDSLFGFTVNTFLETALMGGIGAFIVFIFILIKIFKSYFRTIGVNNILEWSWLVALFAFLVAATFTDHFLFRNLWFILGGAIGICIANIQAKNTPDDSTAHQ